MFIDVMRRRRAEIGMEALMILPVTVVIVLLARFIMEGMLIRQEVAVYTRSGTASAAQAESTLPTYCTSDRAPFLERPQVNQNGGVVCRLRDAEDGLTSQPEFWEAIHDGARPWTRILRDIDLDEDVKDISGDGLGTTAFAAPEFLAGVGLMTTQSAALFPQGFLWTHEDEPLRSSYDPVIWDTLRQQGTWRLFPEVFPARDN